MTVTRAAQAQKQSPYVTMDEFNRRADRYAKIADDMAHKDDVLTHDIAELKGEMKAWGSILTALSGGSMVLGVVNRRKKNGGHE